MKRLSLILVASFILALLALSCSPGASRAPAAKKEPYKIGVTAAMTGPGAAGQLESKEGLRIYIEALNARGGVDGHPIEVTYEDDRAEGAKAVSNIKKFEEQGVHLIGVDSLSAVYAGIIGEAERIKTIPVVTFGVALNQARPPKPNPLGFSVGHVGLADMPPMADIYVTKQLAAGKPFKLATLVADLPLARLSGEKSVAEGKKQGFEVIMEVAPMATADLTPIARKFIDAKADYVTYYGPGALMFLLGDALLKLGYKGTLYVQVGGGSFEATMVEKWKGVENFVGMAQTVPPTLDLPEHKPITDAAQKYTAAVPIDHKVVDGWLNGQVVEEIFKKTGWPVTTEKLLTVMNDLKLERGPLSAPIRWTSTDHIGDRWFGYYAWKGGKVVPLIKDNWIGVNTSYEVIGTTSDLKSIKVK